jgi:glucosamine--fructose-6-phosphate aminotransferase (isomerizing)
VPRRGRAADRDRPRARAAGRARPALPGLGDRLADESLPAVVEAAARAAHSRRRAVASGSAAAEIEGASYSLPVPAAGDRLFAPLLSVVPGQLFAAALARVQGLDADRPERLTKVTLAR